MSDTADAIMVFSRVPADTIDEFMSDPELVLATVEDMGFDQNDMLTMLSGQGGDPGALYYMMEGRWSGEETNFSFEKLWSTLKEKLGEAGARVLKLIEIEGRNSQIYNEYGPVRVLSLEQVKRAYAELEPLSLELDETSKDEDTQSLNDLFPALQTFFRIAADEEEFVLVSLV